VLHPAYCYRGDSAADVAGDGAVAGAHKGLGAEIVDCDTSAGWQICPPFVTTEGEIALTVHTVLHALDSYPPDSAIHCEEHGNDKRF
jgi:hypothetical protein